METTEAFKPKQERIIVKPIMRARNPLITDPDHEAFFLVGSATISYCLPMDRQGNLMNPFQSAAEKAWLESELDLDLNHHKTKGNAWHRIKVKLGKTERKLDLTNPKDYLDYVVLRANSLYVAPNGESMNNRATYRYALVSEEFETKQAVKSADLEMEAYMFLGKIRDSKSDMINFLKVYGRKVSEVSKPDFLVKELKKIVDTDLNGFLEVARDKENYELKLLIADAVECGALIKQGRKYHLPGGDNLCGPGEQPTMAHALEFLKSPANQDIYIAIKARVDAAKE